jgi:ketosteroid isomerase-like protein
MLVGSVIRLAGTPDATFWRGIWSNDRPHRFFMTRSLLAIVLVALSSGTLAAQATSPASAPAAALPSVTLPPELDRVLRDYETAWRANDIPALVGLFTEDGFVLQPGRQPARGHAELTRTYTGQAGGKLNLRALAFASSGDLGYIIGAYGYGDAPGDQGKFTLTLRKVGGRWLIASDMDNGNQPRRMGPPTS